MGGWLGRLFYVFVTGAIIGNIRSDRGRLLVFEFVIPSLIASLEMVVVGPRLFRQA